MSLEDLKKKIYRPRLAKKLDERLQYHYEEPSLSPEEKPPLLTPALKKKVFIGLGVFSVSLVAIILVITLINRGSFDPNKVIFQIEGSQKIESGEFLKYEFLLKNNNSLAIDDVNLKIEYPEGAVLQNPERNNNIESIYVGRLKGGQTKVIESFVRIFGPEETKSIVNISLTYLPLQLNKKIEKKESFAVDIISSPLKLVIDEPKIIALNKNITYRISLSNQSNDHFANALLVLEYPQGFSAKEFSPKNPDSGSNSWRIEAIAPKEQIEISVIGALVQPLDVINFSARLELKNANGQYQTFTRAYSATSLTPAPISVDVQFANLKIPNVVNPDTEVILMINFQNMTDSVLKDIQLTLNLEGDIFEKDSVIPSDNGIYLKDEGKIIWDGRRLPKLTLLGPFEAGTASIRLKMKKSIQISTYQDKNFTLKAIALVKPNIIPPELSGIELENSSQALAKLNSVVVLRGETLEAGNYPISTSGPRPPETGKKTSYLLSWQILNYYNDLNNVSVESALPLGVEWEGEWWPKNEQLSFDRLTGKISWQVGDLRAGTGLISPVRQIIFKVSVIPSPSQAGAKIPLLEKARLQSNDSFTQQNLSSSIGQLETLSSVINN